MSERDLMELPAGLLRCIEYAATTMDGAGWRALLSVGDDDAEELEAVAV